MTVNIVGDRRAHVRFQVFGTMPASVATVQTLRLIDLGTSGALLEAPLPLPPNTEYRMQLVLENHLTEATVKVRRVTPITSAGGAPRYRIGVEFLSIPDDAEDVIANLVAASDGAADAS